MWTNIVIEGFCFGKEKDGKYPCGRNVPSPFCLLEHNCPHFAWSDSSERDAAQFVPLRLILWDKFKIYCEDIKFKLEWWFWDRLSFNRKKVDDFFNSIPVATAENNSCVAKWEEEQRKNEENFKSWFEKAKKSW